METWFQTDKSRLNQSLTIILRALFHERHNTPAEISDILSTKIEVSMISMHYICKTEVNQLIL